MALARWQSTIVDNAGLVQSGASVEVRRESDSALVTLYTDRAGTISAGNPVLSDSEGYVYFHAADDAYKITATKDSFSRIWRYVGVSLASEGNFAGITNFTASNITISPAAGSVALTLNLPGTFAYGIGQQQSVSGTLSAIQYFINYMLISDTADASGTAQNTLYGHYINYAVGGSTVKGSRAGVSSHMTLTSATNAANTNRFYLGGFITANAAADDGGTDTSAGALGYIGGLNVGAQATSAAAVNLEALVGIEINVNMATGSTTKNRYGIIIAPNDLGEGQGADKDAGIVYSCAPDGPSPPGPSGWKDGILFSGVIARPIDEAGNIIRAEGGFTISTALDFEDILIDDYLIRGPADNFTVNGSGHAGIGTAATSTSLLTLAASTTAKSSLRFVQGAAPSAPVDGDMWREDNTNTGLKIRINGVTKTVTVA